MNTQLFGAFGAATPAEETKYDFAPSKSATIAAGSAEEVTFRGRSGEAFAFNHLAIGGDYAGVVATISYDNGRVVLLKDVHLSALRTLFLRRKLKGLLEVPEATELVIALKNTTGAGATVNVKLSGYSGRASIEAHKSCLRQTYGFVPEPVMLSGYATVAANTSDVRIDIGGRTRQLQFRRFLVGSTDQGSVKAALKVYEDTVRPEVYADQLDDEFIWHEAASAYVLEPRTPMEVVAANTGGSALEVSVIFEAYVHNS